MKLFGIHWLDQNIIQFVAVVYWFIGVMDNLVCSIGSTQNVDQLIIALVNGNQHHLENMFLRDKNG